MIVYGDPRWTAPLGELLTDLNARLGAWQAGADLDELRTLLVFAGQVEQSASDALGSESPPASRVRDLTDRLASCFVAAVTGRAAPASHINQVAIADLPAPPLSAPVEVRVPEGFAFYGLFPEQYIPAAERWLTDHAAAPDRAAAVIGIRSIGTTLAAVVAAALRAAGWQVRRWTARPGGHPWARRLDHLPPGSADIPFALVVDEGPGMSGSSFAAVGGALIEAGMTVDRISFFPSHGGGPGAQATPAVREIWQAVDQYVTEPHTLTFGGRSLPVALAARSLALLPAGDAIERIEDWGGGLWRSALCANQPWPPVCGAFEQPKYCCVGESGEAVVWTWAGLSSEPGGPSHAVARKRQAWLAAVGYTQPPLDAAFGFVAAKRLARAPLTPADADPAIIEQIGAWIACLAGPPLSQAEADVARAQLGDILYWNAWECLGADTADRIKAWASRVTAEPRPLAGDQHMAPWEWRRAPGGRLLKTDTTGQRFDHTAVAAQPVCWALAGAISEWQLGADLAERLLTAYGAAGGTRPTADELRFYQLAYAAFRAGQTTLCAEMSGDGDRARLLAAAAGYRDQIAALAAPI